MRKAPRSIHKPAVLSPPEKEEGDVKPTKEKHVKSGLRRAIEIDMLPFASIFYGRGNPDSDPTQIVADTSAANRFRDIAVQVMRQMAQDKATKQAGTFLQQGVEKYAPRMVGTMAKAAGPVGAAIGSGAALINTARDAGQYRDRGVSLGFKNPTMRDAARSVTGGFRTLGDNLIPGGGENLVNLAGAGMRRLKRRKNG